jgi:glycosyltransferase involved in cell wall biosynthesis
MSEQNRNEVSRLSKPLISIVIPTRDREDTLFYTLTTALAQKSKNYEVVVSDNNSDIKTKNVVDLFPDNRIRYFNTGKRLSMCDNYEFALSKSRGEYVIIIGDDDAVIPGRLDDLINVLEKLDQPMIHMWPLHIYDWPVNNALARVAYLAPIVKSTKLNLKEKAQFVIAAGGWKYYELPSPYHSAIPVTILDQIRLKTGRVFHSTQPDVFTAMCIPAYADYAINIGNSVTFNGRSSRSNGLGFIKKNARNNIERFIGEYGDYKFHPTLYSGASSMANMIPDAVLKARDLFPDLYSNTSFGYSAMWAYICRLGFADHLMVLCSAGGIGKVHSLRIFNFLGMSLIHELSAIRRIILNRITSIGNLRKKTPSNISEFANKLSKSHLSENKFD